MLALGIFFHPCRLGSGKTHGSVRLLQISFPQGHTFVKETELSVCFKMTTCPLSLPEMWGEFSSVFTLRTSGDSWRWNSWRNWGSVKAGTLRILNSQACAEPWLRFDYDYYLPRLGILEGKSKHLIWSHLIRFPGLWLSHFVPPFLSVQNLGYSFAKGQFPCRVHQVTIFCALFSWPLLCSLNVAFPVLCAFQGKKIII